ncbi:mate-domain-containing protein [Rhodocollybia butyracea]|uniref:Mate-domain-containing protein n=1 Tax=Rhodocollybia butyracea TaxID=206335 RepID=A0A9P5PA12_9AGAR|nr:mate-domain-containing protein [Rhodocollybia butyracea]
MSITETQHSAYPGPELIAGTYAAERTPLLGHSSSSRAENQDMPGTSQEQMPTLSLLLNQSGILLKSALPVFGTHILEYGLIITSVLAVGHLGKLELAACTLGSMTANVTAFSIIIGLAGALDTVLPGIWGASAARDFTSGTGQETELNKYKVSDSRLLGLWCQRMAVIHLLFIVPMLCIWLNAESILLLLRQDKDVARLAGQYLAMLSFGIPAFAFNTIAKRYFQAQGLFTVPTKIGTVVAGLNILLTGLLVYYPRPLPQALAPYLHLGFVGAPLSTAISYNLVALGNAFWGWRIEVSRRDRREELAAREQTKTLDPYRSASPTPTDSTNSSTYASSERSSSAYTLQEINDVQETRSAWYPLSTRALHPISLGTLLTLGVGGVGQTASEWWAWELIGLGASLLGPTALAAQSVLLVSCSTTYQAPFALGVATSVRIGQLLGLGRPRLAKITAYASIVLGLVVSLIFSSIFWVWRKQWAYLFNDDEDVAKMVASILPLVALFQVFDGNAAITGGTLRAKGKQGTGALLNLSAYYVFGIPLGFYLAFKDVGLPDSLPDHPVINSLANQFTTMLSPSLSTFSRPVTAMSLDEPSLPEATAALRGLWVGLTVSLVYCSVFGTVLCLLTDWQHEVEKVRARVEAEERHDHRENPSENANDEATFIEA